MLPLDYVHAICLVGVALYIWRREPARLLLTPMMLLSFFVLYGVGGIVYFVGADTVPEIRQAVTTCFIIMWVGLIVGIELARLSFPILLHRAQSVIRTWSRTALHDRSQMDQLLVVIGVLMAIFILGVFLGYGKPGQIRTWLSIDSARDKLKYRLEVGSQGGYFYQLLIASVAPFVSFLLLAKARMGGYRHLRTAGVLLCVAVVAGKLGTFEKLPWVLFLLQLLVVSQAARSLEVNLKRLLLLTFILVAGTAAASALALSSVGTGLFEFLVYRFFEVNNEVIYQTFYVYPQHLPHTWGMNIGLVQSIFGSGEASLAHTQVANFFGAVGATFDAFYIADTWVDFGYAGVTVMSVVVGFLVKSIDIFIASRGKTPMALALIGSGTYGVFQLQVTSAFTAFLSGGLVSLPLLVMLSQGLVNDLSHGRVQWQK
jgi:hypothetical protein